MRRTLLPDLLANVLVAHATGLPKPDIFRTAPNAINLHCGLLPYYRGHDTVFWALAKGDLKRVGSTIHLIDAGAGTGAILECCRITVEPGEDDISAWLRAFVAGVDGDHEGTATGWLEGSIVTERYPHFPHRGLTDHVRCTRTLRAAAGRLRWT